MRVTLTRPSGTLSQRERALASQVSFRSLETHPVTRRIGASFIAEAYPMKVKFPGTAILAVVIVWSIPALAHHSQGFYFDTSKAITLEGEILRVEWINPHILLFMQSKNEKGEIETWIIE